MREFRAYIMDHDGHIKLRVDLPDCDDEKLGEREPSNWLIAMTSNYGIVPTSLNDFGIRLGP